MRMFTLSVNDDRMFKPKYGLWNQVSHKIFVNGCKEVWGYIYGGGGRSKGVGSWAHAHVVVPNGVC
jgi:hypothetical protein